MSRALEGVDHVVYSAGGLLPAESDLNPELDLALSLPPLIATLDAVREREGVGLTLLSSGGTVYGRPRYLPVDEEHPTEPISSYGIVEAGLREVRRHVLRALPGPCADPSVLERLR